MSKFKVNKKLDLSFLGEEWKDCYMLFSSLSFGEVLKFREFQNDQEKSVKIAYETVKNHFIEGWGIDQEGKRIQITEKDLDQLPVEVILKSVNLLTAGIEKNA